MAGQEGLETPMTARSSSGPLPPEEPASRSASPCRASEAPTPPSAAKSPARLRGARGELAALLENQEGWLSRSRGGQQLLEGAPAGTSGADEGDESKTAAGGHAGTLGVPGAPAAPQEAPPSVRHTRGAGSVQARPKYVEPDDVETDSEDVTSSESSDSEAEYEKRRRKAESSGKKKAAALGQGGVERDQGGAAGKVADGAAPPASGSAASEGEEEDGQGQLGELEDVEDIAGLLSALHMTKWPPPPVVKTGSGAGAIKSWTKYEDLGHAVILSKQNFPARIVLPSRAHAGFTETIMGESYTSEVDKQAESNSSKSRAAYLLQNGVKFEANYRVFHNSSGAPRYLTGVTAFFRKHNLAQGDVLVMKPHAPGTVDVDVFKAHSQEAKVVYQNAGAPWPPPGMEWADQGGKGPNLSAVRRQRREVARQSADMRASHALLLLRGDRDVAVPAAVPAPPPPEKPTKAKGWLTAVQVKALEIAMEQLRGGGPVPEAMDVEAAGCDPLAEAPSAQDASPPVQSKRSKLAAKPEPGLSAPKCGSQRKQAGSKASRASHSQQSSMASEAPPLLGDDLPAGSRVVSFSEFAAVSLALANKTLKGSLQRIGTQMVLVPPLSEAARGVQPMHVNEGAPAAASASSTPRGATSLTSEAASPAKVQHDSPETQALPGVPRSSAAKKADPSPGLGDLFGGGSRAPRSEASSPEVSASPLEGAWAGAGLEPGLGISGLASPQRRDLPA